MYSTRTSKENWSLEIEGLRGIAVLLPVLYHANLYIIPAGFLGVDIFFVISGYLITGLLWKELFSTGRISFPRFYARRARRILPAAILVLATSGLAMFFVFPDSSYLKRLVDDYIAASLQVFNILQVAQSNSYWAKPEIGSPILHYWSLGVEEQFYLILPVLLFSLFIIAAKLYNSKKLKNLISNLSLVRFQESFLIIMLIVLTGSSFLLSATETVNNPDDAYYLLHYRAWQLGAGALTFILIHYVTSRAKNISYLLTNLLGWIGLGLIFYSALFFSDTTIWPGYHAGVPVLGTMLVIYAAASQKGPSIVLRFKPLRAIGRWSYSLYLWHLPALILAEVALRRELTNFESAAVILGCITLSALTYKFIEQPFRSSEKFSSNRNGLLLGLSLIVIGLLTAFALHIRGNSIDTPLAQIPQYETLEEQRRVVESWLASTGPVPKNLNPRLGDINFIRENYKPYSNRCHKYALDNSSIDDNCTIVPDASKLNSINELMDVWMIGDSHAASWYPAFEALVSKGKIKYTSHSKSGCQASVIRMGIYDTKGNITECSEWLNTLINKIKKYKPDVIFIANFNLALEGLTQEDTLISELSKYSKRIIVLGYYPTWDYMPDSCLFKNLDNYSQCNQIITENSMTARSKVFNSIPNLENVAYEDTLSWFCKYSSCPIIIENIVIMSDTNHLTLESAYMMSPRIEELIFKNRK